MSLEEIGTAECSAGLFDMLDLDKKMMKKLRKALADAPEDAVDMVSKVLFHAARMLLVTRGWMRKLMIRRTSILKSISLPLGWLTKNFAR